MGFIFVRKIQQISWSDIFFRTDFRTVFKTFVSNFLNTYSNGFSTDFKQYFGLFSNKSIRTDSKTVYSKFFRTVICKNLGGLKVVGLFNIFKTPFLFTLWNTISNTLRPQGRTLFRTKFRTLYEPDQNKIATKLFFFGIDVSVK